MERPFKRSPDGKFASGSVWEGMELSPEHKARLQLKAQQRANLTYRHISVCGTVYPNLSQAAAAVGVSTRALKSYADSDSIVFSHVFWVD